MAFAHDVYELCKLIPRGKVTTYKHIALKLRTKGYQAIGQVLRCNPNAPIVPCHRVVASDGRIGGFKGQKEGSAIAEKISLLKQEGVMVEDGKVDLKSHLFS